MGDSARFGTRARGAGTALLLAMGVLGSGAAWAEGLREVVQDAYLYNPTIDASRAALLAQGRAWPSRIRAVFRR